MTQLVSTLVALLALTGPTFAQSDFVSLCQEIAEYADGVTHEGPYTAGPESAGGMSCISSSDATGDQGCAHTKSYTHSVGVAYTVGGGLSALVTLKEIFAIGGDVSFSKSWSTSDLDAVGTSITCPVPDKGQYECGLQVTPKKIKIKGKVRAKDDPNACDPRLSPPPGPWEDYEVKAPHKIPGGKNDGQKADALWEACIRSCGDGGAGNFDCDGVRSAKANGLPLCPDVSGTQKDTFATGWCTGHIIQRQRWQNAVGDRFRFDVQILDANNNEMTSVEMLQVDENGYLSITSPLPYTLDIKTTGQDNDDVTMCYSDQCWTCPGDDAHGCSLGKHKEHGYESGNRKGDFGFTCNRH